LEVIKSMSHGARQAQQNTVKKRLNHRFGGES
jgi:hypothetical protein